MSTRSRTYSLFSRSLCVGIIAQCSNVLAISPALLSRVTVKLLLLVPCGLIYFLYFIQWTDTFSNQFIQDSQTDLQVLKLRVDRSTCCLSPDGLKDVCGRKNCTLPCTSPEPSIPELENDPLESHFISRDDKDHAFFIETSGSGGLTFRQACAVESLALHNPNLTIYVLFANVKINSSVVTLKKLREEYKNIRLISLNLDDYMAGTSLEHWYHCTHWNNGSFHVNNLSNGLRLLTLSKYGGYYFDLDFVFVRPVTDYRNFVAAQDHYDVNNGAIHAELKNPVIKLAIKDFVNNFKPRVWGHNGPASFLRVLKKWCKVKGLKWTDSVRCRGFHVLPRESFYPVHYTEVKELLTERMANETDSIFDWLTEKVIGVHTWNKLSKNQTIYKNSTQDYTRLARDHCPLTFSIAPDIF